MPTPTVSASRLGRYLTASPLGRRSLVLGAQRSEDMQYRPYGEAARAVVDFLAQGCKPEVLESHRARLLGQTMDAAEASHIQHCLEGMAAFQAKLPTLGLEGLEVQPVEDAEAPELRFGDVVVKLRPDAILRARGRGGQVHVGLLKLHFSRTEAFSAVSADYTCALLHVYAARHLQVLGVADARLSRLVDVFAGASFSAPTSTARRLSHIEAACQEVAGRWNVH